MSGHEHVDGSGEGYCSCGAERCSLPGCDMGCVHPGGWVERAELLELRRPNAQAYFGDPDPSDWSWGNEDPNALQLWVVEAREGEK